MRNAIAVVIQAIMSALKSVVASVRMVTRWVGGKLVQVAETVWDFTKAVPGHVAEAAGNAASAAWDAAPGLAMSAARAVGRGALAVPVTAIAVTAGGIRAVGRGLKAAPMMAVSAAASLATMPFTAAGAMLRAVKSGLAGGGGGGSVAQAAAEGEQRAAHEQAKADASADARTQIQAFRRVASALAKGRAPSPEFVDALHPDFVAYLEALEPDELTALSTKPTTVLRKLLTDGEAPRGVRGPREALGSGAGPAPVQGVKLPRQVPVAIALAEALPQDGPPANKKNEFVAKLAERRAAEKQAAQIRECLGEYATGRA